MVMENFWILNYGNYGKVKKLVPKIKKNNCKNLHVNLVRQTS